MYTGCQSSFTGLTDASQAQMVMTDQMCTRSCSCISRTAVPSYDVYGQSNCSASCEPCGY